MLLSLVGERLRARHAGVRLAFAYAGQPRVATTLRKLSRFKYGVAAKQEKLGNAPDFIETLCGIDFLCWIDSASERDSPNLEERVTRAIQSPESVTRTGIVCLGLSDDAVDDVALVTCPQGSWHWLSPNEAGSIELPTWVDHVGALHTRWRRFEYHTGAGDMPIAPTPERFVDIIDPRHTG